MSDMLITKVLQNAAKAAVAASIMPTLPIKYKGRTFTPPNDQKYLEIVIIPNNQGGFEWGDDRLFQGVFRLVLHWPKDNLGVYAPIETVESIGNYFTKTKKLFFQANPTWDNGQFFDNDESWTDTGFDVLTIQVYENNGFQGDIDGGAEVLYPVSMLYRKI